MLRTGPLHSPDVDFSKLQVAVQVGAPLSDKFLSRAGERRLQLVHALAHLDHAASLCLTADASPPAHLLAFVDDVQRAWAELKPVSSAHSLAEHLLCSPDIAAFFPNAFAYLTGSSRASSSSTESLLSQTTTFRSHLFHVNALNQVVILASQLAQDMHLANHKYIAHQLALLYQSLNIAGPALAEYRQRIESHFDDIKKVTQESEQPQLLPHQKTWLTQLCQDIANTVISIPEQGLKGSSTVGQTFANIAQVLFPS